jgi:hypothetical protein
MATTTTVGERNRARDYIRAITHHGAEPFWLAIVAHENGESLGTMDWIANCIQVGSNSWREWVDGVSVADNDTPPHAPSMREARKALAAARAWRG